MNSHAPYRGRLAPSPTGNLHLGHARTFWIAAERCRKAGGTLVLRNEDLDAARFRLDFVDSMIEDLRWLGLRWQEGPDVGGPFGPYNQSERRSFYRDVLARLHKANLIYPCNRSRRDVLEAAGAPHEAARILDEPIYPPQFRPSADVPLPPLGDVVHTNWRFRVPDGATLSFDDGHFGLQQAIVGQDFGDFLVWRKDDTPSYQLACVVDDSAMQISEVVRGADLILSSFRQILLYQALGYKAPSFYHCPLMTDASGVRLAKRHDALSLRLLRESGRTPASILAEFSVTSPVK